MDESTENVKPVINKKRRKRYENMSAKYLKSIIRKSSKSQRVFPMMPKTSHFIEPSTSFAPTAATAHVNTSAADVQSSTPVQPLVASVQPATSLEPPAITPAYLQSSPSVVPSAFVCASSFNQTETTETNFHKALQNWAVETHVTHICNEKQISSDLESSEITDSDHSWNIQDLDKTLSPENIQLADMFIQGDELVKGNGDQSISGTSNTASDYSDIMSELKEIRSLVTYTIHRVGKIEQLLQIGRQSEIRKNLLPTLPLTELSQLKTFEENLADENTKQQLFDLLRFTGGSRERDCVNRTLEKVFSNYLAQFCSWTGKKNNYKLSTLKLMASVKLAVKDSFPNMTDESFERHVMSWFQHASTRLKRQNID